MAKKTGKTPSWVWKVSLGIGILGIVVSIVSVITVMLYYQPRSNRLEDIYHDFAVVEDYYEIVEIAQAIPLPNPLGPIEHLDYSPITVYAVTPDSEVVDFRGSSYGYILKLSTGLNTYLATSSDSPDLSEWEIVYTIGELRENRLRLRWFLYNGPIPPEGWIQNTE